MFQEYFFLLETQKPTITDFYMLFGQTIHRQINKFCRMLRNNEFHGRKKEKEHSKEVTRQQRAL